MVATQAHHLGPREVTGDGIEHLIAACGPCNRAVGAPDRADPDPAPTPVAWWD